MNPVAERIANVVYQNTPGAVCFSCLAELEGLREHAVRTVALILMVRAGLHAVRQSCAVCRQVADALTAQKAA
jgi:hypothetical protein